MRFKKLIYYFSAAINYYYQAVSVFHHPRKKVIQESYLVNFTPEEETFLEKCAQSFNYAVDYSKGFRQKELFIVPLTTVTFLGNSGAVVLNGKIVTESVFDQMRLVKSPAFRSPALLVPKRKTGRYVSIMHLPWAETSNYHWFLDVLPRLFLLQHIPEPLTLIVPQDMPVFQRETLNFLLVDCRHVKLETIAKNEKWQITDFILPSFVANHNSGYLPEIILKKMRSTIWAGYNVINEKPPKRCIYISRQKAKKRKILNEEEVLAALQPYQVEVIFAEELSYQQQVQLFYNAAVIIAPHGAGLTNILFSQQARVLELHPADIIKSHYFMLSKGLKFPYFYSIGSLSDHEFNFTADIPDFKLQLERLFTT